MTFCFSVSFSSGPTEHIKANIALQNSNEMKHKTNLMLKSSTCLSLIGKLVIGVKILKKQCVIFLFTLKKLKEMC